jgi:magnesium transporter
MRKFLKERSRKAGLPPGTPVHIGERRSEITQLHLVYYENALLEQRDVAAVDDALPYIARPGVTWLHAVGAHDTDRLKRLECIGLHPLVIEDILNTDQRTKFEDYGEYAYLVLKMLSDGAESGIEIEQISIVLGKNYVVSVEEGPSGAFASVQALIDKDRARIRQSGADYLAYLLLDKVVDNYFIVLERLGEQIDALQDELVAGPRPETLRLLHHLRRETLVLRRSVWPLREVIGGLERERSALIRAETAVYLRDVYDHTIHVVDTIETFREMLSGMLELYMSSSSNRLNEVIKVLTVIATVFIPPTFIASVYGMNFRYLPELGWRWGYAAAWVMMIGLGAGMLVYFKKKRWL